MRMVLLYQGWNSGTNRALLDAWRRGSPDVQVDPCDVARLTLGRGARRLAAVLRRREGSIVRTRWYINAMAAALADYPPVREADFTVGFGTTIPGRGEGYPPHFVYTDHTIRANLLYEDGAERVRAWSEVLDEEARILQEARMVFTMSRHVTRSLQDHYGLDRARVRCVGAGCNIPVVYPGSMGRFANQHVLFIGVDWRRKGGPALLEAFRMVRRHRPAARLTVIGCKPKLTCGGVRVVGPVSQVAAARYLGDATLFCMPSVREPFGIVYLEAMRAGLPVIALRLGAAPDFVIDGVTGYTVPSGDVDALAMRLERLLGDPAECRQMGRRGRQLVDSWYTWSAVQQRMAQSIHAALRAGVESVTVNSGGS